MSEMLPKQHVMLVTDHNIELAVRVTGKARIEIQEMLSEAYKKNLVLTVPVKMTETEFNKIVGDYYDEIGWPPGAEKGIRNG